MTIKPPIDVAVAIIAETCSDREAPAVLKALERIARVEGIFLASKAARNAGLESVVAKIMSKLGEG